MPTAEQMKQYRADYRARNREMLLQKGRERRALERQKAKDAGTTAHQLYLDSMSPERRAKYEAQRKQSHEANRERHKVSAREWYEKNATYAVWKNIQTRAKKAGIPFDIEPSDIEPPEFCPVLGIRLQRIKVDGRSRKGREIDCSPSVDRIKPELGYTKGNVIVISYRANRIKNDATVGELLKVAYFYQQLASGK